MYGRLENKEWLTPNLLRLVMGGEGLAEFDMGPFTDAYLNVAIPCEGVPYEAPFDLDEIHDGLPPEQWPYRRRYTVRRWAPLERLLTIDVVVHGDDGVGGPWAANAQVGDALVFAGPRGAYRPDPEADWHLMVGDESALPAIAASMEAIPAGVPVVVRVVVDGPEYELPLSTAGELDLVWLHRREAPRELDLLPDAVRDLTFPAGRVHAFVHGEAGEVREVRRHLLAERGLVRSDLSASPYWRRELADEAWRRIKAAWNAEVERDVA